MLNPEALSADEQLERDIYAQTQALRDAATRGTRREQDMAWFVLKALVDQRSPQQIERMERERGLR